MKNLKGLALQDMLTEVHSYVHRSKLISSVLFYEKSSFVFLYKPM